MSEEGTIYYRLGVDTSQVKQKAQETKGVFKSLTDDVVAQGDRIDKTFMNIGKTIAGAFAVQQLSVFTKSVMDVRGEIQSLEVSFRTLLGNKDKADELFSQLREFAVKTPLMLKDLSRAAQTLLSFNVDADKVMPTLRALGDISMGDAQKLQSLTLAFSQMSSTGKLMGQDLLQMINAGFNPLTVISEKTGKSIATLKDEMSKGAISAETVADAFMSAASEGGKFYGMLEAKSQTIQGSMSNLQGAWEDMLNTIGEESEGIINGTIQSLTELVKDYENVGRIITEIIATYGVYKAALITLTVLENARHMAAVRHMTTMRVMIVSLKEQVASLTSMLSKNKYAMIAAAIAAVAYGIYKLATYETEAEQELKKVNARLAEQDEELRNLKKHEDAVLEAKKQAAESTAAELSKIDQLNGIIHNNALSLEGRRKAIADMQAIVPAYHATIDDEGRLHKDNTKAVDDYIDSLNRLAIAKAIQSQREQLYAERAKATLTADQLKMDLPEAEAEMRRREEAFKRQADEYWKNRNTSAAMSPLTPGGAGIRMGDLDGVSELKNVQAEYDAALGKWKVLQNDLEIQYRTAENATKELEKLDKIAQEYQKELNDLNKKSGGDTGGKEADKAAARLLKIEKEKREAVAAVKESEFEIAQAQIDAMKEGYDREMAQADLNHRKREEAIRRQEEEMVEALRDRMTLEYQNQNPKASKAQVVKYSMSITSDDLTEAQKAALAEMRKLNDEALWKEETDSAEKAADNLKKLFREVTDAFSTEEQRRVDAIHDTYEEQRKTLKKQLEGGLLNEGQYQTLLAKSEDAEKKAIEDYWTEKYGSYEDKVKRLQEDWEKVAKLIPQQYLPEATKQYQAALSSLNSDQLRNSTEYQKLFTANMTMAKEEVHRTADAIRSDLIRQLQAGNISARDFLETWDKINERVKDSDTRMGKLLTYTGGGVGSLLEMISRIGNDKFIQGTQDMEKYMDAFLKAKTAGDDAAMSASSNSMQAAKGMQQAGSAMSATAGKAAGAVGAIDAIINGINDCVQGLAGTFELMKEMADALGADTGANSSWGNFTTYFEIFAESSQYATDAWNSLKEGNIGGVIKGVVGSITSVFTNFAKFNDAKIDEDIEADAKALKKLNWELEDLSDLVDEVYGKTKKADIELEIANIEQQIALVIDQIKLENEKKNPDYDKIDEYKRQVEELRQQLKDYKEEAQDALFGDDIMSQIESFADAVADAWADNSSAAKSAKDYVTSMMKQMVSEAIKDYIQVSGAMQNIRDAMESAMLDDIITEEEKNRIYDMAQKLADEIEKKYGWAEDMFEEESERTGSSKGIANASQESVDELNGRMTAVQGHTFSISENTKLLLANTSAILQSVLNIESNTDRLAAVESGVKDMRSTLNDIALKGVKIK